ncbi:hypothetical protein F5884DRAFT_150637 [Xylogone sp. PMI_703]|nr:hypothetical protein F5884DRAFT_150637 [Xylogone sp. PMI_703]
MTQKRRRLHIGGGGLQGFGYAAGNYNTGYFDISLESNNISTTSQQHRASLSITQSNQDLPSNANASFTTYSRQHSISNEGLLSPMSFKSLSPCTSSMRRNIGNGMAFNGIVKLRGKENYQEWYRAVRAAARKEGVWDMLTGDCSRPHPPGPGASLAEQQEYHDNIVYWNSKSELALGGIEGSLEKSAQASVDNIECPRAMWLKLERDYNPLGTKVLYDLMQKLDTLNLSGDVEKLADDLRELKKRIDTQREADALPHWYYTIRFLRSLAPAYEEFVSSMMDRDAASGDDKHRFTELTFEQVVSKAMAEEQRHTP